MDLEQFRDNLLSISVNDLIDETVVETEQKILGHNKEQMLFGKGTDGQNLGYYKWPEYAEAKAKFFANYHAPFGVYNYYKFGSFQDLMYARPLLTAIEIGSKDKKTQRLETLAGGASRVFGLTEENKTEYADQDFKPVFIEKLKSKIFKT